MGELIWLDSLQWEPLRPDVAKGVSARTYYNSCGIKVSYVRVVPGGQFELHRDAYGHLLHFLEGTGLAGINGQEFEVGAGAVLKVVAGDEHFYCNTGEGELRLISVNL